MRYFSHIIREFPRLKRLIPKRQVPRLGKKIVPHKNSVEHPRHLPTITVDGLYKSKRRFLGVEMILFAPVALFFKKRVQLFQFFPESSNCETTLIYNFYIRDSDS